MLDLKFDEIRYEEYWKDEDNYGHYYFTYPQAYFEGLRMLGIFKDRAYYEVPHGLIAGICLQVIVSPDGEKKCLSASPTCVGDDGSFEDVGWVDIDWDQVSEEDLDKLIRLAEHQKISLRFDRLHRMAFQLEEQAAALKTAITILKLDYELDYEEKEKPNEKD